MVSNESVGFTSFENLPPVLKVKEIAALLRISLSQAYELIAQGVIPSIRFGKAIRVPRAALEEHLSLQDDPSDTDVPTRGSRTARKAG
jgi:excisionase family DNA binding protein